MIRENSSATIPVTVLTGFLGSGKTTLLNRILTEHHGKRIAVIENEYGEIGIDHELVVNADEEVFEMNNGCICCTVRGDLIRILGNLIKRRDRFDSILIETTGLADPGPVVQTFYMDDELGAKLRLDGIVTLVDAKHVGLHMDEAMEAQQQIAFADVILLNKSDLTEPNELDRLETRIHAMNAQARIHRTTNAEIDLEKVLNLGGFNLGRALEVDPQFMEPEYPFEWGGVFELSAEDHRLVLQEGPDPAMRLCLLAVGSGDPQEALATASEQAVRLFSDESVDLAAGGRIPAGQVVNLQLDAGDDLSFLIQPESPGRYGLFTEHHPDEFEADFSASGSTVRPLAEHAYKPDHEHDDTVSSVGIDIPGDLDQQKLEEWMRLVLANLGPDIFRMKGVLSIAGMPQRFVFQGVHMLFDGRADKPWGHEPRQNRLIFIGRNLDAQALEAGFRACLATPETANH